MWPLPSLRRFQRAVFPLGATSRHAAVIALVWALLIGGLLAGMDSIVLAGMLVTVRYAVQECGSTFTMSTQPCPADRCRQAGRFFSSCL